jgi:hypothetical protein
MEVNGSSEIIEKFNERPCTISFRKFQATFSIVVYEFQLKYDVNYIEAFAFKQLARHMHYEVLNVYEQHFPRILGVTQIPNLAYATTITTTFQTTLQATIVHHGAMSNNPYLIPPDLVPTSLNLYPQ